MHQTLILNAEVLYLILSQLKLNCDLVTLFFCCFEFRNQYVFVDLNFLLTLLHGHLELVFSIFETIDAIGLYVNCISKFLDFKFHAIMLHERLLLILEYLLEIPIRHLILEFELLYLRRECEPLILDLIDGPLDIAPLILELLVRDSQLLQCLLLLVELLLHLEDLLLQPLGLLLAALATRSRDFALHLLNLELSIIKKLLLSLLLLLQLDDVGLEVA